MDKVACDLGLGGGLADQEVAAVAPPPAVLMDGVEPGEHVSVDTQVVSTDDEEAVDEEIDDDDDEEMDGGDDDEEMDGGDDDEEMDEEIYGGNDEEMEEDTEDDESGDEQDEPTKVKNGQPLVGTSRNGFPLVPDPYAMEGEFLGPARFASVGSTAGFMRVAVVEEDPDLGREIVVLYRYTRFSRTWSGRRGVEVCRRAKLHRFHFTVPAAGDPASSLKWAGSLLGSLVYPVFFKEELHELWSRLVAPVIISPQATCVEVMLNVGILRRYDETPERMEYMRGELEANMEPAWPGYHVGTELNLPEPVVRKRDGGEVPEEEDGALPPAKQKRVVAELIGEECPICFDELETGLVAWPGCSVAHVFHDECLQMSLKESFRCPICRHELWRHE